MESDLRHLLEEGFAVAVVRDATAGPRLAAGDGYLAALTNYSFLAHAVWMTEETVSPIRGGRSATVLRTGAPDGEGP
jgi:hypothetical protein